MKKEFQKIILFITVLFAITIVSKAQTFPWVKSAISSGGGGNEGLAICLDQSGNSFITGIFDSPNFSFGSTTFTNAGNYDLYLAKYDTNGNLLWAKDAGDASYDQGTSVCTDFNGNAFITGSFQSPTLSIGSTTLTNVSGWESILIAKYDPTGNVLWANGIGGTQSDIGYGISSDAAGNVYITGKISSPTIIFGTYTLTNAGGSNVFIAKYDSNGNVLWADCANNNAGNDIAYSVSTDLSGNAYINGSFSSPTISFGTYTLTNTGSVNTFIAKYDMNGNVLWAKSAGGVNTDEGLGIATDVSGNAFTTGYFSSPSISFGSYTLTNQGNNDMFLTKYDVNGNVLWAKSAGGPNIEGGYSISTYTGGVFVTGTLGSSSAFGTTTLSPPSGSTDPMFIIHYDLNGNVICGAALASGGDDWSGVSVDKFGNSYITGDFMANPFIIGSNTLTLSGALEEIFITKLDNCFSTSINTINEDTRSKLFPNPNNGSFKLKIDSEIEKGELILMNSLGQKVHEQKISRGENDINTNSLAKGLYHYILSQNKEQLQNGKIAIE